MTYAECLASPYFSGDLTQLRSFYYAALYRSFTRAAEQLMTTQPSVSSHIKALEKLTGRILFDRHGRGATLTPAGEVLFDLVEPLIDGIDQLQSRLKERLGTGDVEEVRMAAGHELLLHLAGPALRSYREAFPDVMLVAHSSDRRQTLEMVLRDQIDFGIASGIETAGALVFEHVFADELFLICPLEHPLAQQDSVSVAEAAAYPLLMPNPASSARAAIEAAIAQTGAALRVSMELERWHMIKEFVALSQGIAFVPGFSVAGDGGRLAIRPVRGGLPPLSYGIVTRRGRYLSAAARNLIKSIRDRAALLHTKEQ